MRSWVLYEVIFRDVEDGCGVLAHGDYAVILLHWHYWIDKTCVDNRNSRLRDTTANP